MGCIEAFKRPPLLEKGESRCSVGRLSDIRDGFFALGVDSDQFWRNSVKLFSLMGEERSD